jgi:hypothetical protein
LSENSLTSLPSDLLNSSRSLTYFDASNNDITLLLADLFLNSVSIKRLFLQQNNISVLDGGLFRTLSLLEEMFAFCARIFLIYSDLGDNSFTTMPTTLLQSNFRLKLFSAANTPLQSLSPAIFQGLSLLGTINLRLTAITFLAADTFVNLTSLRRLDLFRVPVSRLSPRTFSPSFEGVLVFVVAFMPLIHSSDAGAVRAIPKLVLFPAHLN